MEGAEKKAQRVIRRPKDRWLQRMQEDPSARMMIHEWWKAQQWLRTQGSLWHEQFTVSMQ